MLTMCCAMLCRSVPCFIMLQGLGKTLQSITFLAHLKWVMNVPGPHLVVVPLSVMSSWMTELARWCPELRAVKLHTADTEERKRLKKEVGYSLAGHDCAYMCLGGGDCAVEGRGACGVEAVGQGVCVRIYGGGRGGGM